MSNPDQLLAALERSRTPWNQQAVAERIDTPRAFKSTATLCTDCEAPCETNEVCVSAIADAVGLLDEVGRDQAFRLIESGVDRLAIRDEVAVREDGDHRPSTFVSRR